MIFFSRLPDKIWLFFGSVNTEGAIKLEITRNSQQNTYARDSFLIKLQTFALDVTCLILHQL